MPANPPTNPIDALFVRLRSEGRKAFMPFLTAGDPSVDYLKTILPAAAAAGASLMEIGFPYSDPIADGPTIQASYTRALDRGLKVADIFRTLAEVSASPEWKTPLAGMVSWSLIHRRGPDAFLEACVASGLHGAVVPDLPADEADDFAARCRDRDFKLILLVTPTTPMARAERIVALCSGFLYCVSVVGITGERDFIPEPLRDQLARLRNLTDLPLCVGFGVSKPEHVAHLKDIADGVIVGSAIVRHQETGDTAAIAALISQLAGALKN